MKVTLKFVTSIVVLSFGLSTVSVANADNSGYWPEFGTLASHNEWAMKVIGGDVAHQLGATGSGIKVAVLDSGVSPNTPGLAGKIISYKDFLPSQHPLQEHGTMTASTVAADYDPATGVGGIAPGVSLIIGRVCYLNSCDSEAAKKAILWSVQQGAQVISMSFGGADDPELNALLTDVTRRGVVVVAALGNNGCNTYYAGGQNRYCQQGRSTESSMASYPIPGLIGAGASDHFNARASFSSWGPNLDLVAPGVDNIAYDPNGATNGFGGTSAATPLIAGAAALILEANPSLTPAQVQAVLQATVRPALETKPKVWDYCEKSVVTNLWDCHQEVDSTSPQQFFTGAGILAADKAVLLARRMAAENTFSAPIVSSINTAATVSWTGGNADLYINSKLVTKNVSSPYSFSGELNSSFSIQLVRGDTVSNPALVQLKVNLTPKAPLILAPNTGQIYGQTSSMYFGINDVRSDDPDIDWMSSWTQNIGGVFEFTDGTSAPCRGYDPGPPSREIRGFSFTCRIDRPAGQTSGRFRLLSPDSVLGEPSELLTVNLYASSPTIEVRTTYLSDAEVRFEWGPVPGAKSYEIRYKPDSSTSCITETTVLASGFIWPAAFFVSAKSEDDCLGNLVMASDIYGYRLLKPAPSKPTNIRVKDVSLTSIEFEATLANPTNTWRVYRSDGLFMRFDNPGQKIVIGVQPNEDVNGRTFTYRFMEIAHDMWGDSWSVLSDPIAVSFPNLAAPKGSCFRSAPTKVTCDIKPNSNSEGTLIEFLNSEGKVVLSRDTKRWSSQRFTFDKVNKAYSVRLTSTSGDVPNWYRRGESINLPLTSKYSSNRFIFAVTP
jgi:subtilisin family serine protease